MANPVSAEEPSMEEILASIRRIISDDDPDSPLAEAAADEGAVADSAVEAAAEPDPVVLDTPHPLSAPAEAEPEEDVVAFEDPEPEAELEEDLAPTPVLNLPNDLPRDADEIAFDLDGEADIVEPFEPDLSFAEEDDLVSDEEEPLELTMEQVAAPAPAPPPPDPAPTMDPAPATSGLLSSETGDKVSSMLASFASPAAPAVSAGSSPTVDDLVREMMRPMLKQWLDANLPDMVEKLVKEEIRRLSSNQ